MEKRASFTFDRLIDQIIEKRKTATADRIEEQGYIDEWDTGLDVGEILTVYDSNKIARCKIRILKNELCKWSDIPEWLWRGETNDCAEEFREDHVDFFDNPDDDFEFIGTQFELTEVINPQPGHGLYRENAS